MPNQTQIARALGLSQGAVSLALRGSSAVSEETREKVLQAAKQMGYQPNMYANRLMSHIRSGKKLSDRDTIALVVEARSLKEWLSVTNTYHTFYTGLCRKAFELGQTTEAFFLKQPGMDAAKLDRILYTRGIHGIIMAPPYHGNRSLDLTWSRYAAVAIGFGWEEQDLSRVVFDQLSNYITAFGKLRELGYKRIGTVLTERAIFGNPNLSHWHTGYLDCQNRIPKEERIPVFVGTNETATPEQDRICAEKFKNWVLDWKPDAVLSVAGSEKRWIEAMGKSIPEDIGLACLAKPVNSNYAGINEQSDAIGAVALEQVAARLFHNDFGLPANPTTMMVNGCWSDGPTVRRQS